MKKNMLLFVIGCVALLLFGCGKVENPMENASPTTSMLSFYKYDGDKVIRYMMSDSQTEREILDKIGQLDFKKVNNWSPEDADSSIYGLSIVDKDGYTLEIAWHDNYWIKSNGEVLTADFDLCKLETEYTWELKDEFGSVNVLPCMRCFAQTDAGWNRKFMAPAEEVSAPENITMTLLEQSSNGLKVRIDNKGQSSWEYGEFYSYQVLLDGTWYEVPTLPGDWAFVTIAYILPAGESTEKGYGFEMYGEFPSGTYRLVVEGLTVEFEI